MSKVQLSTPKKTPTGFTRALADHLFNLTRNGLLNSRFFKWQVPTEHISAFVITCGAEIGQIFKEIVEAKYEAYGCRFNILVDYDEPIAIRGLPKNGRSGVVSEVVIVVRLDKKVKLSDLPRVMQIRGVLAGFQNGYNFATPQAVSAFLKQSPGMPDGYYTLFEVDGQTCSIRLYSDGQFFIGPPHGNYFTKGTRFLVVPG